MKIAFVDFWEGFCPSNNLLFYLFRDVYENVEVTSPSLCDVLIYCSSNWCSTTHKHFNHCKRISFNGECLPNPNYNECDYSITSFFNDFGGKNVRIPLWMFFVDWYNVTSWENPGWLIPVDYLNKPNEFSLKPKNKFCCTVFGNPVQNRLDMINVIKKYKDIDCYGHYFNNRIPQAKGNGEIEKMHVISDYKFSLCFENREHEDGGWYTEKLLHAKVAGTIPIFYTDKKMSHDFNEKCCLNLSDYDMNMDAMLEDIIKIDTDDSLYEKILNEPLFTSTPNLERVKENLSKTIIL